MRPNPNRFGRDTLPINRTRRLFTQLVDEDDEDSDLLCTLIEDRWLGTPRKHGLRADFHCLAFALDPYARAIVFHACGGAVSAACSDSYSETNVMQALKNYCGGNLGSKYANLLIMFNLHATVSIFC
jgi:hypothetical protein